MKAVLIQAPCWQVYTPPYNLALLKSVCKTQGHDVVCLDLNIKFYKYLFEKNEHHIYDNPTNWYNEEYVKEIVKKYARFIDECVDEIINLSCRIIGFTTTGPNSLFSKTLAEKIKLKAKEKIILFGGTYCFKTEFGETLLRFNPYIDMVCYLEGENVLPQLLETVEKTNKITCIPGIAFRNDNNEIIDCFDAELMEDLDSLPFADYSDFKLKEYVLNELPISTSRGCINRCLFCSESRIWNRYRTRSAENIFAEIKYQVSKYPFIKSFYFNDSLINGNMKVLDEFCSLLIRNNLNISWGGQAVIREEMTGDFIRKMKMAGFSHVSYGLESASARILKIIGKRFAPELAERVIRDTKKSGIRTDINIVVGFPAETEEDVMMTAKFLKGNRKFIDEIFFHPLVVSRGSHYYKNRDEWGIKFEDESNPNSWYSTKEENNLSKRLKTMEFYQSYINKGESFFLLPEYYLFLGDASFNKGDYEKAEVCYKRAKEVNQDEFKDKLIKEKLELTQERISVNKV